MLVLNLYYESDYWIASMSDSFSTVDYLVECGGLPRKGYFPGLFSNPAFSPDGNRILFATRQGSDEGKVWIYDVATNNVTRIVDGAEYPAWNPDGTRVVYTKAKIPNAGSMHAVSGNGYLWIIDLQTENTWQLTYY
jgi:Tol biopolymer transport system component